MGSCAVDLVITSGGTGMAKRDVTIETVEALFDKKNPGFPADDDVFRLSPGLRRPGHGLPDDGRHHPPVPGLLPAGPAELPSRRGMEKVIFAGSLSFVFGNQEVNGYV